MEKYTILTVFLFLFMRVGIAQNGDAYFDKKDFYNASKSYELEVLSNPSLYYKLGQSLFALQEYDRAAVAFQSYVEKNPTGSFVSQAKINLLLINRPDEPIYVRNMGPAINSSAYDGIPYIAKDGKTIYYTGSDRVGGLGGEDIWYAEKQTDGSWSQATLFPTFNTSTHEGMLSMSSDNRVSILFGNYEGSFGSGDLFFSVNTDGKWSEPCNLGGSVNTDNWDAQASLAFDGKTLLMASDREGTSGDSDLWVTWLTDMGWIKPINLGSTINSFGAEGNPILAADGKTLYFYSTGHPGFGGRDLFMSRRLDDTWQNWTTPVNFGKYINTFEDDHFITIPASGNKCYFTKSNQADGYGDADLYEFVMPPAFRPEVVFNLYGFVTDEEKLPVASVIRFYDENGEREMANAISKKSDGSYKVSLPVNQKYLAVIDMKGYLYTSDIIDLTDSALFSSDAVFKDKIALQKQSIINILNKTQSYRETIADKLDANTENIGGEFSALTDIIREYKKSISDMDFLLYDAKANWLTEEVDYSMRKDFSLQSIKVGAKFELKNIFFEFGKASLKEESKLELNKLYDIMRRSDIVIELGGHTDNVGSDESNQKLSQERVESVRNYLIEKGLEGNRIAAIGYGESRPIAENDAEEGRAKNRRVEVQITEIRPREGKDVVQEQNENNEISNQIDLYTALSNAAKKGGLPEGSPCDDNYSPTTSYTKTDKSKKVKKSASQNIDFEDFIYGKFNAHLVGMHNSLGAGVAFVNEESFKETHIQYFFQNPENISSKFNVGRYYNFQITESLPLLFHFGGELLVQKDGEEFGTSINLPVGARYLKDVGPVKVGPELVYSIGILKSDIVSKGSYLRIGANAKWKLLQGGLFINAGDYWKGLGMRAGIAF